VHIGEAQKTAENAHSVDFFPEIHSAVRTFASDVFFGQKLRPECGQQTRGRHIECPSQYRVGANGNFGWAGLLPVIGWRRRVVVSGVRRMNKVNARRARLVPGWVTVFGRVYHLGM